MSFGGRTLPKGSDTLEPIPFDRLPQILDPADGFLQNCNDPPWTATESAILDSRSFSELPTLVAPTLRAQRSIELLAAQQRLGPEEIVRLKHDTRVPLADRVLDALLQSVRGSEDSQLRSAAGALAAWDRCCDRESRGAALFICWAHAMEFGPSTWENQQLAEVEWTDAEPATTPRGLAKPDLAAAVLKLVVEQFERSGLDLDQKWGDLYRWRLWGHDRPVSGGTGEFGILRAIEFEAADSRGVRQASGGDGFAAVALFAPDGIRLLASHAPGHGALDGMLDVSHQVDLLAENQMRAVTFERPVSKSMVAERENSFEGGGKASS